MTTFIFANNVNTQLAAAASSSATTLTLASSSNLPTLSAGQAMPLTLNDAATGQVYEVVYVTAISGVTLTVTRAQEGTTAQNWNIGDFAFCAPTAGTVAPEQGNPANTFQIAPATQPSHAAQFSQLTGCIGQARNASINIPTASASTTFTADQIIVGTALNGLQYSLASYNQVINLGTTGAGGMDTGSAPASGFVALYAIYNPASGTASILATNATSATAPTIYNGAHMPTGYTASALIGVLPTNSSGQFAPIVLQDREVSFTGITVLSTTTQVPATALTVTSVPKNARFVSGVTGMASSAASIGNIAVYANAASVGAKSNNSTMVANSQQTVPFSNLPLSSPQTLYYATFISSGSGITYTITLSSYIF